MATSKLQNIRPQRANANRHTQRGLGMLEQSIQKDGWIGAITVAADGETFDGSARIEVGVGAGFEDAIVVESDGSKPIIHRRTDIPSADHPRAKRLGVAANRVASVDLEWDTDVLSELAQEGDVLDGLFFENELDNLLGTAEGVDPSELWRGMPEFEYDQRAIKTLYVHFQTADDVAAFSLLIGQDVSGNTKSIWFPQAEKQVLADKRYSDEP